MRSPCNLFSGKSDTDGTFKNPQLLVSQLLTTSQGSFMNSTGFQKYEQFEFFHIRSLCISVRERGICVVMCANLET